MHQPKRRSGGALHNLRLVQSSSRLQALGSADWQSAVSPVATGRVQIGGKVSQTRGETHAHAPTS